MLLRLLQVGERVEPKELRRLGEHRPSALQKGGEVLFGLQIDALFLAQERVNGVDEKVHLRVELQLHRLRILGAQGERDELRELLEEGLALPLVEELNRTRLTASNSFLSPPGSAR